MLTSMAPLFRMHGIACDVIALLQRPSPLEQTLLNQNVHMRYTGVDGLYSPRQILELTKLIRGYDIVHVHLFPAQLWTVLAAVCLKSRPVLITTEHHAWNARRRWWLRPVDLWMYPHYKRIACISEAAADNLRRWCPSTTGKIVIIPNGIPLHTFENAHPVQLQHVPGNVVRLVFVGRFAPPKDHSTLFRALTALPDVHLLLVGDGPLRSQLEQMAHTLGIRKRVTFLGWRNDVAGILKSSDIYVHSTYSEAFGIAACEAMAAGLPVVASDVPGLAQLVSGVGILFPAGNDKALANVLATLIESPDRQRAMSAASVQRARQFKIEDTVNSCIRMYESVLEADFAWKTEAQ
jgi:glycosyltransferase involved in cell wall biosynthesis